MTKNTQYALGIFGLIIILFLINNKSQSDLNVNTTKIFDGDSSKIFRFQIINKIDTLDLVRTDSTWEISQADTLIVKNNQIIERKGLEILLSIATLLVIVYQMQLY